MYWRLWLRWPCIGKVFGEGRQDTEPCKLIIQTSHWDLLDSKSATRLIFYVDTNVTLFFFSLCLIDIENSRFPTAFSLSGPNLFFYPVPLCLHPFVFFLSLHSPYTSISHMCYGPYLSLKTCLHSQIQILAFTVWVCVILWAWVYVRS